MTKEQEEAIETLRWNLEYTKGRFFKDDGSAADDEFRMSLDAMDAALAKLKAEQPPAGESETTETKALIKVLEIYSETNDPVSQKFYQGLCLKAKESLEELHTRLDRCEASKAELIKACERIDMFLSLDFPKMTATQWAITVGNLKSYLSAAIEGSKE